MSNSAMMFSQHPATPSFQPSWLRQEDPFEKQPFPASVSGHMMLGQILQRNWVNSLREYLEVEAQTRPDPAIARSQLLQLHQFYAVVSQNSLVAETLTDFPALFLLLKEAVEHLNLAFGKRLLQLEALQSDEGSILRVVKLPLGTEKPAERMRNFKRAWWFKNCSRSDASLVFDYETGDGF